MERNVPFDGTKRPRSEIVSSVAVMEEARGIARRLERREMSRGHKLPEARKRIAEAAGVAPGTLVNLAKGRLKRNFQELRDRVRAVLIRELEQEIGRLAHEIAIHRRVGAADHNPAVAQAETHLQAAKQLLNPAE